LIGDLHRRYELGFIPPNLDGKRHEIKIKLTEEGRRKLKSAELRYAPAYLAAPNRAQTAPLVPQQDAALAQALSSTATLSGVRFDASGRIPSGEQTAQFRLYIDPRSLTWLPTESDNGAVQARFTLAAACFSTDHAVLSSQVKDFAIERTKAEQSADSPKAVILNITSLLPAETSRVRFVLRDAAGHLGSFEMAFSQVKHEAIPTTKPQ
jgi:hypothetical protein